MFKVIAIKKHIIKIENVDYFDDAIDMCEFLIMRKYDTVYLCKENGEIINSFKGV